MITLVELVGLLSKVLGSASIIQKLGSDSRKKVSSHFTSISQCLNSLAKKRKVGDSTDFECSELGIYLDRIPHDLINILGEEYVNDLVKQFRGVVSSPSDEIFVTDNEKISPKDIESLAGKLQGLANTI